MFSQRSREQLSQPLGFGILQKTLQRYEIFRNLYRFIPKKNKNNLYTRHLNIADEQALLSDG